MLFQTLQRPRGWIERRHVRVVPARVHYVHVSAIVGFCCDFARIGQAGVLFDRQRIHVGAHQDRWPDAVFHDCDDAVAFQIRVIVLAEVFCHFAAGRAQFLRYQRRRIFFVAGKLRVTVKVSVNREQRRQFADGSFSTDVS